MDLRILHSFLAIDGVRAAAGVITPYSDNYQLEAFSGLFAHSHFHSKEVQQSTSIDYLITTNLSNFWSNIYLPALKSHSSSISARIRPLTDSVLRDKHHFFD